MRLSVDIFGNKCLVVSGADIGCKRGFSIQTNGNLPAVHGMTAETLDQDIAFDEVVKYVREHGTTSQRAKMGV